MAGVAAFQTAGPAYAPARCNATGDCVEPISFDDEEGEPAGGLATIVMALASALACLPAAVAIVGPRMPAPLTIGLGLAGMSLAGLKVMALLYGAHKLLEDQFRQ
jgi:hypothetical protein